MKKADLKRIVNALDLKDTYKVYMGGSLLMRGFRDDTHDLDWGVSSNDYKILKERFCVKDEVISELGDTKFDLIVDGFDVEIFDKGIIDDVELIEGIWCQKLEDIIELKKSLNREKDIIDLEIIYNKQNKIKD